MRGGAEPVHHPVAASQVHGSIARKAAWRAVPRTGRNPRATSSPLIEKENMGVRDSRPGRTQIVSGNFGESA